MQVLDYEVLFTGCETIPGLEPGMSLKQVLDVILDLINNNTSGEKLSNGVGITIVDGKIYLGIVSEIAGKNIRKVLGDINDHGFIFGFNDGNNNPLASRPNIVLSPSVGFSFQGINNANVTSENGDIHINAQEIKTIGNLLCEQIQLKSINDGSSYGYKIESPNGTVFKLVVDDNGNLSTVAL